MNIKTMTLAIAIASTVASPLVSAAGDHMRRSFNVDVTRSNSAGRTMHRHTEQVANQHRFQRQSTWTAGNGKTATRSVQGSYNPDNKTYTRSMEGTRFNGDTYSAQRTTQKTDNGYTRTATRTNAAGATASRQADVVVDRDNRTVTKNISATGFNGETHSATVVKTYNTPDTTDSGE